MWISRTEDAARVRPLGGQRQLPGIGSRGAHTAETLDTIVGVARQRISQGEAWRATGGYAYRTYPFRHPARVDS
eukprot:3927851-Prymnesium_polylepis.1